MKTMTKFPLVVVAAVILTVVGAPNRINASQYEAVDCVAQMPSSTNEAERIAAEIAGWLEPHRGRIGLAVNRDGDDIYMYGSFGSLQSAMVKALLDGGDGQAATSGNAEDETVPAVELPLLTRMLNAYDAWAAARYDLTKPNSTGSATRSRLARRKYMKYCGDNLTEEEWRKEWPFNVEAFEKGLAEKIVCDECGLYRVKGDCNDYDEGAADDGNLAVRPLIRWVNRKMEAWATNVVDAAGRSAANDDPTLYSRVPDYKIELVEQGREEARAAGGHIRELIGDDSLSGIRRA